MARIIGKGPSTTTWGTRWDDTIDIRGAAGGYGQGGNDTITGDGAANKLVGGDGHDHLVGNGGNDALFGGTGNDYLSGGSGNDMLYGDAGNDRLSGGSGNDRVRGGDGNDIIEHTVRTKGLLPASSDDYQGGSGTDTLLINVVGETENYGPARPEIRIDDHGNGVLAYTNYEMESDFVQAASFSGIERFQLTQDSAPLAYRGGALNATVLGGSGSDLFQGGSGDEMFDGGAGGDLVQVLWRPGMTLGYDYIRNFDPTQDAIAKNSRDEYDTGPDPLGITSVEKHGHTFFTFTDKTTGTVVGMLEVDTVGIPPIPPDDYIVG
ncbi:hypothetical protein IGS68_35130 (plasmid) [Skermanella sp. TT6]|uniref:Hemolysin type calcium-binding protein n=1 Tax=Skermanella cutis TaxID=2775420 RepID=A0ABX7BI11_9PROT|nr:calcium-binding protein [Skermanella sp. TT6]QQP94046.1 hypothetical protein IGS68_35130 [Skermanella sp. TT6]